MKKIITSEFKKYINRMFYEAKLDLKDKKSIKDGEFNIKTYTITDIKLFKRKNDDICGTIYVDGKKYWYDYTNIDDIRKFLKRKFENGVQEAWWKIPKTDDFSGLECAELYGEWFNIKNESIQKEWIYKRLVAIAKDAYKNHKKCL